jgi:hypothetical protein
MPALWTSTASDAKPAETRSAIQRLDSRVSWPITTLGRGFVRNRSCPRARPIKYVLSSVSGNSPATPRMPSVPNNCRCVDMDCELCDCTIYRNFMRNESDRGATSVQLAACDQIPKPEREQERNHLQREIVKHVTAEKIPDLHRGPPGFECCSEPRTGISSSVSSRMPPSFVIGVGRTVGGT